MFRTVLVTIYLHYLFSYNYNNPIFKNFYCHDFTEKTNKLKFQAGHKPSVLIPKLKLLTLHIYKASANPLKAPAHLDSLIIFLTSAYISLYFKPIINIKLGSQLNQRNIVRVANESYQEKLTIIVYLLYVNHFIYIKLNP